jgi:predicted dehydrogenase
MSDGQRPVAGPHVRVGVIGAGTIAGVHSTALTILPALYPNLSLTPRLVAIADVDRNLADRAAQRYGYERAETDWRAVATAGDVDLVVVCVPPALNREVVEVAAHSGKHVVCEKPLSTSAEDAAAMLRACQEAGVFHALGAGYRWTPALRAIRELVTGGQLGDIRSARLSFLLDYGADERVPLLWRFRRAMAGGGIAIDTGYHLIDCARYLVGEIDAVQALTALNVPERPVPGAGAVGNRGDGAQAGSGGTGAVDVEDAAAALLSFESGAYGVLETSRVTIGKRIELRIELFGSQGSADWNLEHPDEFRVCLPGDASVFGYRRVLVNPSHPGAADLLVAGTDGTGVGWLGQECAMWAEFLTAVHEGRAAHANFDDGVRANAVIDALYVAAESGMRTKVVVPASLEAG